MIKIGLTGGIGSGKSYVAKKFEALGIPVYYADARAKILMYRSPSLKSEIKNLLGKEAYHNNGRLNRPVVAQKIFNDKKLLKKLNGIVHPAVYHDFVAWADLQKAPYVLEESAIIFESKIQARFDKVILVTADKALRIQRVVKRDRTNPEQIKSRMKNQLSDEKKIPLADFVIYNNGDNLDEEILDIHNQILKLK